MGRFAMENVDHPMMEQFPDGCVNSCLDGHCTWIKERLRQRLPEK